MNEQTSCDHLVEFMRELSARCAQGGLSAALVNSTGLKDYGRAVLSIQNKFDAAFAEVERAKFRREQTRHNHLKTLDETREAVYRVLVDRKGSGESGQLLNQLTMQKLVSIAEAIAETLEDPRAALDRSLMAQSTTDFIEEVKGWTLREELKKPLLFQLQAFSTLIKAEPHLSDEELVQRLKSLTADFGILIDLKNRQEVARFEELRKWTWHAIAPAAFLLGLAADSIEVAGYLEANKPPLAITDQSDKGEHP